MNRINSRFNSLKRDPISTITVKLRASALTSRVEGKKREERAGSIRANMNRINSRFNSLKRDPISTITVKLRASALKETT